MRSQVEHDEWARVALKCLPLLLAATAIAGVLLNWESRYYQGPPWVHFAAVLLLAIGYAISLHGLNEWTGMVPEKRLPLSHLLLSLCGALEAGIGLAARAVLRHRCRLATLAVIFAGLVNALAGLGLAGWEHNWPGDWTNVVIFHKEVPLPHIALLITLLACRYQMFAFLMVGLAGLAFSIHVLGHFYFQEVPTWPKVLMSAGAICFFAALYLELRRTRANTIDDVVSQARL